MVMDDAVAGIQALARKTRGVSHLSLQAFFALIGQRIPSNLDALWRAQAAAQASLASPARGKRTSRAASNRQRTTSPKESGVSFAEIARLNSNDLSAARGGDLGWLNQGDTVPDFEKAMDALKIKEVSAPIQSPFGFHLIQVLERRTEDATAERQRQTARQVLRERKADEAHQDWIRQMRDRAYVEYRVEER